MVVEGGEYLPRQGPALLLVKHWASRDTLLLSLVLYRFSGRFGNYLMKGKQAGVSNRILEALGGVKVIRAKDIRRIQDRAAREAYLDRAREFNRRALAYVSWLYSQGEVVITYPEGMFYEDRMGPVQTGLIKHTLEVGRKTNIQIPFIPVGLEYESLRRPRAGVVFRIGAPLYPTSATEPGQLSEVVKQRLGELSGFDVTTQGE